MLKISVPSQQILVESQGGNWNESTSSAQKLSFQAANILSTESKSSQERAKVKQHKKDDFYSDFDDLPSMARSNTVDGGFDSYQNSG